MAFSINIVDRKCKTEMSSKIKTFLRYMPFQDYTLQQAMRTVRTQTDLNQRIYRKQVNANHDDSKRG